MQMKTRLEGWGGAGRGWLGWAAAARESFINDECNRVYNHMVRPAARRARPRLGLSSWTSRPRPRWWSARPTQASPHPLLLNHPEYSCALGGMMQRPRGCPIW